MEDKTMNELKMISDYKENEVYRQSFNELAKSVFCIDFESMYQTGFWKDRYICYSYIDGDRVVSNVSVNKIDLIINGISKKAIQLGTVMTDPDYRGKGLARKLIETIINHYEDKCEMFYLFANESVLDFYPKFGFKLQKEYVYHTVVNCKLGKTNTTRKLNVENAEDLELIKRMAKERIRLSNKFATENTEGILGWYCLNVFSNCIYYIKDLDAIVIYDIEDGKINLYDVLSRKELLLEEIINQIAGIGKWKVSLNFTPDFKDADLVCEEAECNELFIRGGQFPDKVTHPITARA
jgi:GNAT superfamily N-acetyltransferase